MKALRVSLAVLFLSLISTSLYAEGRHYEQNRRDSRWSDRNGGHTSQAYDLGYRAGENDYNSGRAYNYKGALIQTAGIAAISGDYRRGFEAGYRDGFEGADYRNDLPNRSGDYGCRDGSNDCRSDRGNNRDGGYDRSNHRGHNQQGNHENEEEDDD